MNLSPILEAGRGARWKLLGRRAPEPAAPPAPSPTALFDAITAWDRLYLRSTGGPSEAAGVVTGWPEAQGGPDATIATGTPAYDADPLRDGSGPCARLTDTDGGFLSGLEVAGAFTAFVVMRHHSLTDYNTLIGTAENTLALFCDDAGVRILDVGLAAFVDDTTAGTINRWILIREGSAGALSYRFYVDGASVGPAAATTGGTGQLEFGSSQTGNFILAGDIFACGAVAGVALDASSVAALDAAMLAEVTG